MWNAKHSTMLSKVCVLISMVAVVVFLAAAPWIIKYMLFYSYSLKNVSSSLLLTTIYSGGLILIYMLINLYKLLNNIQQKEVFVKNNINYLRHISWCCFVGGLIALLSSVYLIWWIFIAVAAAFVGIIVRVVKNVIQEAVQLKEENDFTI